MRLAPPFRLDTVILGKPKLFPCSPLEDRFDLHPVFLTFSPFLTLDEEVGPSPVLLILSASSFPVDLHLLLDDSHFAGDIRALAGGKQEREAGHRGHGIGHLECDETHRRRGRRF
jgi:hypothetical protein